MNKWLNGKPDIRNGLLVSGEYDNIRDDTKYYDVYTYPQLNYIGRFNASRFREGRKNDYYPQPDELGFRKVGDFTIWRELYPNIENPYQWLEVIHWGNPYLITKNGVPNINYCYAIVNWQPLPFDTIINNIIKNYKEKYDRL